MTKTSCILLGGLVAWLGWGAPNASAASTMGVDVVSNSVGMKLALIPAGEFKMGTPTVDSQRELDEDQRSVRIEKAFRIGVTEVTQAEWAAVMGKRVGKFVGEQRPVESVSWKDAQAFCEKLSQTEGRTYRLPTEAEWEYACRAGATGRYSAGEDLKDLAWFDENSDDTTHDVATKKPNAWGLYDMHGNVAEWCADAYALSASKTPMESDATPTSAPDETKLPPPTVRVVRGGWFGSLPRGCRCAARMGRPEGYEMKSVGFRVVLEDSK